MTPAGWGLTSLQSKYVSEAEESSLGLLNSRHTHHPTLLPLRAVPFEQGIELPLGLRFLGESGNNKTSATHNTDSLATAPIHHAPSGTGVFIS